jgi:hypothetical protein
MEKVKIGRLVATKEQLRLLRSIGLRLGVTLREEGTIGFRDVDIGRGGISLEQLPRAFWVVDKYGGNLGVYLETELEKNMIEKGNKVMIEKGNKVRVKGLTMTTRHKELLRGVGVPLSYSYARKEGTVGIVSHVVFREDVSYEDLPVSVYVKDENGNSGVYLVDEIELLSKPAPLTPETFEAAVLELLSIFPNQNPSRVLSYRDSDDTDVATIRRVVPQLRKYLRKHPVEIARNTARREREKIAAQIDAAEKEVTRLKALLEG